jgi:CubicO group peptidase (beta-lactamase class C family)
VAFVLLGEGNPSIDQVGIIKFNEAVTRVVESGEAPGIVALLDNGSETHVVAAGTAAVGGPDVERVTLFRITSMTKPITAVAASVLNFRCLDI